MYGRTEQLIQEYKLFDEISDEITERDYLKT